MTVRERILAAVRELVTDTPIEQISLARIARHADVSWPTVRRHLGGREQLRAWLAVESPDLVDGAPSTRERILAAASRVFARHGYNGATVDQVAADAGMTKGAVYWHFASKCDLFLALLEADVKRWCETLPAAVRRMAEAEDPVDGLANLLREQIAMGRCHPEWPRLYMEFSASSRDPEVRKRLRDLHRSGQEMATATARRMQREGRLCPELNPRAIAILFRCLVNGLVLNWLVHPEQVDPESIAPELARILWRGLEGRTHA
ncbi:MAG TPA: TetR family transcriptional regulator [Longimicrobiales bacterium]